jgi:MoaA/NifB/PqqE/SkfB family radical SAM enzyme
MTSSTFKKALAFCRNNTDYLSIGGGEPTVHPRFWELLGLALGADFEGVWMATNGKITRIALALAGLTAAGELFRCELSQDEWHDPIDPRVVEAFRKNKAVRTTREPYAVGRAVDIAGARADGCVCSDFVIRPNGDIHPCGCPTAPKIGSVLRKEPLLAKYRELQCDEDFTYSNCWTDYMKRKAEADAVPA